MVDGLTLKEARGIVRRAVEKGMEVGWISAAVVMDEGGNVLSMSRMDGAAGTAVPIAKAKAYLAAITKFPTTAFATRQHEYPERWEAYRDILLPEHIFPGLGGMPIVKNGTIVGGFGTGASAPREGVAKKAPGEGFWTEVDGQRVNIEDLVSAHALEIPYSEQHGESSYRT